jgi:phenylpropionate dioxygenase-like ring-hydroxylating dioxygenase large terminal subunit
MKKRRLLPQGFSRQNLIRLHRWRKTNYALATMAADFNSQVFEEDKTICEEVQLGTAHASPMRSGELSSEEQLVLAFQQAYAESMRTRTTV